MEGKETKKDGGNLVLIIIIAVLFVVTAFCAYKLGVAGRSVVDDTNLQKGGNTSVPNEVEGKTDYLVLVNKQNKLPSTWEETVELEDVKNAYDEDIKVEKEALAQFKKLREALLKEGVNIELDSSYRSVKRQQEIWDEFTEKYGEDYVKKYVAVPGYSEHHTGLAIDVCLKKDGKLIYENDDMMKEKEIWAKVHKKLADYGFILRYPEGKDSITGYAYEPWHFRYVGSAEVAKEITEKGLTFEEYLKQNK